MKLGLLTEDGATSGDKMIKAQTRGQQRAISYGVILQQLSVSL